MVDRIYPAELQLKKAYSSDTKSPFMDLNLLISNGTFPSKFMINRTILILFSIVIISLGEEGAGLCASRAFCLFVLYVLIFVFFLFLLVSGAGCGL